MWKRNTKKFLSVLSPEQLDNLGLMGMKKLELLYCSFSGGIVVFIAFR